MRTTTIAVAISLIASAQSNTEPNLMSKIPANTISATFGGVQPLQFEVATLKRTPPRVPGASSTASLVICHGIDNHEKLANDPIGVPGLGRCMATNATLRLVISAAYPSPSVALPLLQRIIGGSEWIDKESFNIEGKAENTATVTEADLKIMLRQLLADRFKLQLHTEAKEVESFALGVAKDGAKLKPGEGPSAGFTFSRGTMSSTNATMEALAQSLTRRVGRLFVDRTGLTGSYAITLPANLGTDPNGSSVSTVLKEELGVELVAQKVKVDIIVIDRAERPTVN